MKIFGKNRGINSGRNDGNTHYNIQGIFSFIHEFLKMKEVHFRSIYQKLFEEACEMSLCRITNPVQFRIH